jgi:hypothetical protein
MIFKSGSHEEQNITTILFYLSCLSANLNTRINKVTLHLQTPADHMLIWSVGNNFTSVNNNNPIC